MNCLYRHRIKVVVWVVRGVSSQPAEAFSSGQKIIMQSKDFGYLSIYFDIDVKATFKYCYEKRNITVLLSSHPSVGFSSGQKKILRRSLYIS